MLTIEVNMEPARKLDFFLSQLWRGYYKTRETIQKELSIEQKNMLQG
jgi:hypothetical protein